ncbi:hypothetical protein KSF78_0002556 [Schistosoma japonicum]|nr:hypothetical protein KSF78_0002556 [Schistosoma japonicum]
MVSAARIIYLVAVITAVLCAVIAIAISPFLKSLASWLLAALWVTFLCLLIAIIIWVTNTD